MRLKEIKPGMVIHCTTKHEVLLLLEMFPTRSLTIGLWENFENKTCLRVEESRTLSFDEYDYFIQKGQKITEFSDLIIPELSAKEVLETIGEICDSFSGRCGNFCPLWGCCTTIEYKENSEKAIDICTKWREEHPKEEEKKVEVEQFWEIKCLEDPSYHTTEHYKDEAEALRMCVILAEKDPKNSYYAVFVAKAKE